MKEILDYICLTFCWTCGHAKLAIALEWFCQFVTFVVVVNKYHFFCGVRIISKLRVMSCELTVASVSWNMQVASWKVRVDFARCELKSTSWELQTAKKCEFQVCINLPPVVFQPDIHIYSCRNDCFVIPLPNKTNNFTQTPTKYKSCTFKSFRIQNNKRHMIHTRIVHLVQYQKIKFAP